MLHSDLCENYQICITGLNAIITLKLNVNDVELYN